MIKEWLRKAQEGAKIAWVAFLARFVLVYLSALGLITLASDTGFSDLVEKARTQIHFLLPALSLLIASVWQFLKMDRQLVDLRAQNDDLRQSTSELHRQRDQVHMAVLDRIHRAALFGLMQSEWREKGARITQFRVAETDAGGEEQGDAGALSRLQALINIGMKDHVEEGMTFLVHDPTNSLTHGLILVDTVHAAGSTCKVVKLGERSFWAGAFQACEDRNSRMLDAPGNVIVPNSTWPGIGAEAAREIIAWVRRIGADWNSGGLPNGTH